MNKPVIEMDSGHMGIPRVNNGADAASEKLRLLRFKLSPSRPDKEIVFSRALRLSETLFLGGRRGL